MLRNTILAIYCFCASSLFAQQEMKLYLIPGQGSDHRIFQNIEFPANVDTVHVHYLIPERHESMPALAKRMAEQIDTTSQFAIMGVSLGGMLACEMTDILNPEKVIIISSAKTANEIPDLYRNCNSFPVHEYLAPGIFKSSAFILQPLYEYDRPKVKSVCVNMLHDKDALFLKRATNCIVRWERTEEMNIGKPIVHIHGDRDNTLPLEDIDAGYVITGGSHLMTLTKAQVISEILVKELNGY